MIDIQFAYEIVKKYGDDSKKDLTLLKLQKLYYYCFGAALAYDLDNEVIGIEFEAWKYGPVNKKIHYTFKNPNDPYFVVDIKHKNFIAIDKMNNPFSKELVELISVVVDVYGRLTPRSLVKETQDEKLENHDNPWKKTYIPNKENNLIDTHHIKQFFKKKFNNEEQKTFLPIGLLDYNSFLLDNIPIVAFKDLFEIAYYLKRAD